MDEAIRDRFHRRGFLKLMALAGIAAAVDWSAMPRIAGAVAKKSDAPVVVIGAGLGGLTAAAYLTHYGFPVTLIEKHDRPGGYATAFKRGGKYRFDVSLHATVMENALPQRMLTELGVWNALSRVNVPEFCAIPYADALLRLPSRQPEAFIRILAERFPKEAAGIRGFVEDMQQVRREMMGHVGKDPMMDRLETLSLDQWLSRHTQNPELRSILAISWGYYGLPPSKLNALFYAIATGEYLLAGGQYFKTRSQNLSDALMGAVKKHGGQVLLKTQALRIGVEKGKVNWVEDDHGNRHPARAVVANAGVPNVINTLLGGDHLPATYRRRMAAYAPSLSSCIVWLGVKGDLRESVKGYEVKLPEDPDMDLAYRHALNGDFERVGLSATLYDHLFDGYSPPGSSTMTLLSLCGYAPWRRFEADYRAGRKRSYNRMKQAMTDTFINRVEAALAPGLRERIEVVEAATPLTNMRYTGNPEGAIYGFARPGRQAHPLEVRTPLTGLYLAGAWTHGGGYTPAMMAGRQAAQALLEDMKAG